MNIRGNQLHQETDRKLRKALLEHLDRENEPTVGRLCEDAGINRSTFYRHYRDVYDLMEQTEREIQHGLIKALATGRQPDSDDLPGPGKAKQIKTLSQDQLLSMIRYVKENRHFYRMYMNTHSGLGMEQGFRSVWENSIKPLFLSSGVYDENRMLYYYEYVKAGVMVVLRRWLERDCPESEEELSRILWRMLRW